MEFLNRSSMPNCYSEVIMVHDDQEWDFHEGEHSILLTEFEYGSWKRKVAQKMYLEQNFIKKSCY